MYEPPFQAVMADAAGAPRRAVAAWILYDLANTIFSFVVLSFYFGPWLTDELGARDSAFTVPESLSMLVVLALAPLLGALSDRTRRIPFLVASTAVAVAGTALLGLGGFLGLGPGATLAFAVVFFVLANIGFQLGLVFYDALLPFVSTRETVGRIGALGVGIGYLGSFVGLVAGAVILGLDEGAEPVLFAVAAALFLLFSIPAFVFVRERRAPRREPDAGLFDDAFRGVLRTLRALPRQRPLARFLLARVLYADAVNTLILILGIYAVEEVGFRTDTLQYALLLGLGIAFAALGAPLWGVLVDRIGPRHALGVVLLAWMFTLTIVVLHPVLDLPRPVFYVLGAFVGICLGGTWAADRPLLVGLAPRERVGEWFGLYAMAGRFAAVTGPLLYSLVVDVLLEGHALRRPAGVFVLLLMVVASFFVLRKLTDPYKPEARPFAAIVPWSAGAPRPTPRLARLPLAAPFIVLYVVATWALFWPFAEPVSGAQGFWSIGHEFRRFTFAIPELSENFPLALARLVWVPFLNHDLIQLAYVTVILLFGVAFEAREGTLRTLSLFYLTTFVGGIVAGVALHLLYPEVSTHPVLAEAWERTWSGGSVGAFGLMGAFAARARSPWFFLVVFALWEVNVGYWFLRSYTPAFHLTALLTGFAVTRYALPALPRRAPGAAAGT